MIFYKSKKQIKKSFRRNPLDKISSTESKNERKRIRDKLDRIQCIYLRAFRIGRGGGEGVADTIQPLNVASAKTTYALWRETLNNAIQDTNTIRRSYIT